MASKFVDFLIDLGGAIQKQEEFNRDPDGVMNRWGLSAEEKEAAGA